MADVELELSDPVGFYVYMHSENGSPLRLEMTAATAWPLARQLQRYYQQGLTDLRAFEMEYKRLTRVKKTDNQRGRDWTTAFNNMMSSPTFAEAVDKAVRNPLVEPTFTAYGWNKLAQPKVYSVSHPVDPFADAP